MRIAIDISQIAFEGSGVARYTHNLVQSLVTHSPPDITYTFFYSSLRKPIPAHTASLISAPHKLVTFHIPPTLLSFLWNTLYILPIDWLIGQHDIVVSSDWTQPPVRHGASMTIIHDLVPLMFPETSTQSMKFVPSQARIEPSIVTTHRQRLKRVQKSCVRIIADSYSTKSDIAHLLKFPLDKINVVYPPVSYIEVTPTDVSETRDKYTLTKPYIVAVGKREPRKNLHALIDAYSHSSLATTHDLVLIGSSGWGEDVQIHSGVRILGFVSDSELFSLYKGADFMVMPSLYEGFGFPILEAMAVGCPVACSNNSSLGELAQDHAITFDPTDTKSIKNALEVMKTTHHSNPEHLLHAQKYARSFTEKAFAHACIDTFRSVYSKA